MREGRGEKERESLTVSYEGKETSHFLMYIFSVLSLLYFMRTSFQWSIN